MSSASHSPVTFTQLVALYYSYQRIILVWGACPAVAVLLPLATKCSFFTLDWVTDGHAVLSLFLTAALVTAGHFVMSRLASSKQALQKAYVSNQVRLPFGSCLGGMVASRFLFGPLLAWSGLLARVPVFGNISFVTSLWLAIGLACLGMAVVARYIGPASIMRCSAFPLVSNPLETSVHHLFKFPMSILEPSDTPAGEILTGGRFQHLSLRSTLSQLVLSIVLGIIASASTVSSWIDRPHNDAFAQSAILACCVFTVASPLVLISTMNGHEIDPQADPWSLFDIARAAQRAAIAAIIVPVASMSVGYAISSDGSIDSLTLAVQLLVGCLLMSLYLQLMDQAIRYCLFYPKQDMARFINDLQDDSTPITRLQVILDSLFRDKALVQDILKPTLRPGVVDLDSAEIQRLENLMKVQSAVNLSPVKGYQEAPLEEDVLRIVLLESFGGREDESSKTVSALGEFKKKEESLTASRNDLAARRVHLERHTAVVKDWVEWKFAKGAARAEPLVVPLVRAFCVFAAGFGESLFTISHCKTKNVRSNRAHDAAETWTLPQGAVTCAAYAVVAATRCILFSLNGSTRPNGDWKSSQLSLLVPSALTAFFRLRCGALEYSKPRVGDRSTNPGTSVADRIGAENPEILYLLRVCDDSAHDILSSIRSPKCFERAELPVDKECLDWVKKLLS